MISLQINWFPVEHPVWASPISTNNTAAQQGSLRAEIKVGFHACDDTDLRTTGKPSMVMVATADD